MSTARRTGLNAVPYTPTANVGASLTTVRHSTGNCLRAFWGLLEPDAVKAARPVCAVRRFVVSPTQSAGTRKEVLGSLGLPESESGGGQQHAEKAVAVSKAFRGVVPQDPRDMAKAGLLEAQSPVVKVQHPSE